MYNGTNGTYIEKTSRERCGKFYTENLDVSESQGIRGFVEVPVLIIVEFSA